VEGALRRPLGLGTAMWSARNVRATVGMPCGVLVHGQEEQKKASTVIYGSATLLLH
jgi:hypothetical protein